MKFLSDEKAKLELDASNAYGWLEVNWKRVLVWAAVSYASYHYGPVAGAKVQSILHILGM